MFQFAGFASRDYVFIPRYLKRGGFPHSEIPGSTCARNSPGLIATCYVLHRLSVPRHPPNALIALDRAKPSCAEINPNLMRPNSQPRRACGRSPCQRVHAKTLCRQKPHPAPAHSARTRSPPFATVSQQSIFTMVKSPRRRAWPAPNLAPSSRTAAAAVSARLVKAARLAKAGGGERNRTVDLLLAKQALSQLSYTPVSGSQYSAVRSQSRTH